ncbi:hypothetical protein HPB52_009748 [Rhipicephalus sanguineus]|uniref:Cuticular protein n=1 Tax=Rhipicephalus sanguineus TaxID=34632 RepID=A0A9D4SU31_RHISA|nr:hypothetical protein HPB52_009748 [Rhipicephalus sanguineus]
MIVALAVSLVFERSGSDDVDPAYVYPLVRKYMGRSLTRRNDSQFQLNETLSVAKMVILLGLVVVAVTMVQAQQAQGEAYQFRYDIPNPEGGNHFHEESSDAGGARRGSYGVTNKEGQFVNVEYVADEQGYRPVVKSNVPVLDGYGTQHREEKSNGLGGVKGSYGYTDAWGRFRQVHYVADKYGFRAKVLTNEPGTSNQHPAAVRMISSGGGGHG